MNSPEFGGGGTGPYTPSNGYQYRPANGARQRPMGTRPNENWGQQQPYNPVRPNGNYF